MSETTEKVYCLGDTSNNTAALLSAMNSAKSNPAELMALMGNNNGWNNNPFVWIVFLAMFGRNGWFGGNGTSETTNADLNRISAQMADNQNSNLLMDAINGNHSAVHELANNLNVSTTSLSNAVASVQNAITAVGGQVGMSSERVINSILLGNKDLTSALQSCCCENKQLIQKMGYEGQLQSQALQSSVLGRIDQLSNGISQGFSQVGYANAQNTAAIQLAGQNNTQRIIDTLNNHWNAELQQKYADARLELSQQSQNAYLISQLKTTTTTTTA